MVTTIASGLDDPAPDQVEPADLGPLFDEMLSGVDLLLRMQPGAGPGPHADGLVRGVIPDVLPGTADHLAIVLTASGPVNLVGYRSASGDVGLPENRIMFCVAELLSDGAGAVCGSEPIEGPDDGSATVIEEGPGRNSVTTFGGADAVFALVTTEEGAQVGIVAAAGWVFADWPATWGKPERIVFFDAAANVVFDHAYDF